MAEGRSKHQTDCGGKASHINLVDLRTADSCTMCQVMETAVCGSEAFQAWRLLTAAGLREFTFL
jgi:hypothetical protein